MNIAVITGASSGIGREFTRLLGELDGIDEIWALARNKEKLASLSSVTNKPVRTISADVASLESLCTLTNELNSAKPNVKWLINSAGFGKFCAYNDISAQESVAMIKTNCEGVVGVTLCVLPYMNEGARIVNMGSAAAFQPLPYENIYAATKAFVRSYSRALNRELKSRKITVTCACPSWVQTDFFKTANDFEKPMGATDYSGIVLPADVAKKALADAMRGRDMSVVTMKTKFEHLLSKLLPQSVVINAWMKRQNFR